MDLSVISYVTYVKRIIILLVHLSKTQNYVLYRHNVSILMTRERLERMKYTSSFKPNTKI